MEKLVYLSDVVYNPDTVLTVGTFDGVHQGHRVIIDTVVRKAAERNARSVVLTFDPHPREIINAGPGMVKLLTTLEERVEILAELGIDQMIVIPFTRDFSLLSSTEFIEDIIYKKIGVTEFVIGYDHQFGRNREGTIESLKTSAQKLGFDVRVIEAHEIGNVTISSTLVRKELEDKGNTSLAYSYLGRHFKLAGTVIHGEKRGRLLGYPTANLRLIDKRKVIPRNGVYAVDVRIEGDTLVRRGMMNIGYRPTFSDSENRSVEVHVIDFEADLYGKILTVSFLKRIRDEQRFNGLEAIREQLAKDRISCLAV